MVTIKLLIMSNTTRFDHSFIPRHPLKSAHIQTLFASLFTALCLSRKKKKALNHSKTLTIKTPNHGKLTALLHKNKSLTNSNKTALVILLHGWEGSNESGYILRTASHLITAGFDVLRLNFRDHGNSHHLNDLPFNSVRLQEVEEAIIEALKITKHDTFHLIGFSLGGNFSLRLAEKFSQSSGVQAQTLLSSLSICAPIEPERTSYDIENGLSLYHNYFVKKWHRSLKQKYRYYPELIRSINDLYVDSNFKKKPSLNQMNEVFVPLHTGFDKVNAYLNAYRVTQKTLDNIKQPTLIIWAEDDPVIDAIQYKTLKETLWITLCPQHYGGHCGFIKNIRLDNWLDSIIEQHLKGL